MDTLPPTGSRPPLGAMVPVFGAVVRPLQAFFRLEASGGIVLLACAALALAWVNLGGGEAYRALLGAELSFGAGGARVAFSLQALVNDGLMTAFFFLVGMEIKRELVVGELRTPARALLPAIAALGGMVVPALLYFGLNRDGPGRAGWGIPMATDIAFCIGCLTLLKRRVSQALIVFLTALAIFDDIGGILVIALFYGGGLHASWLLGGLAVVALLALMSRLAVRSGFAYALVGAILWTCLHQGGIHATIAGVVLGLAIPARAPRRPREVLSGLTEHARQLLRKADDDELDSAALLQIEQRLEELEPPLERFVHALHPWVAYGIMPAFALANSGVDLSRLQAPQLVGPLALGTGLGLVLGKPIGIFSLTWAAIRLGLTPAPSGATLPKLLGVSMVAGIGFTVALFIANLAFPGHPDLLDEAKFGIIAGSLASGLVGCLLLSLTRPVRPASGG